MESSKFSLCHLIWSPKFLFPKMAPTIVSFLEYLKKICKWLDCSLKSQNMIRDKSILLYSTMVSEAYTFLSMKFDIRQDLRIKIPQSHALIPWARECKLTIRWHDHIRYKVIVTSERSLRFAIVGFLTFQFPNNELFIWDTQSLH